MIDYTMLKIAADHAIKAKGTLLADAAISNFTSLATPEGVHDLASAHEQLKAENEALRSKLTTVHFVCDQLPDFDGCRFIELENPQGESLGGEVGEWEIRPDGLAQLVVTLGDADLRKDAERYRWICNGHGYFFEEAGLSGRYEDRSEMNAAIDAAIAEEAGE